MSNRFLQLDKDIKTFKTGSFYVKAKTLPIATKRRSRFESIKPEYSRMYQRSVRVAPSTLRTSANGRAFIKEWEGFVGNVYNDAHGYCTVGYGHLIARNTCENITIPEEFRNGISRAKADELFLNRLPEFERAVQRDITVPLHQYEFDALVSLLFNTGSNFLNTGGAGGGETQIKRLINAGRYEDGADEMRDVTNGGLRGLVNRRNSEIRLFKTGVYNASH